MGSLAREKGFGTVFVPAADAIEARLVEGVTVMPVTNLHSLVE